MHILLVSHFSSHLSGCCPHLACLHVTKLTQNHSVSPRRNQALGSFIAEDGRRGSGVHPITDSNEVKYSLADGEQDSGMVEHNHAVKPPLLSSQVC